MADDGDGATYARIQLILDGIHKRQEREACGLAAEESPLGRLSWAELSGAVLRAGAVVAAEAHGHSMSAFGATCSGQPEAGLVAACRHQRCTCLIYHQEGAAGIVVAGMDVACPFNPLPAP